MQGTCKELPIGCASTADSGLMVECESCSRWCHSKCVGITQATAATFPFVCPFCVKSLFTKLVNIDSVIEGLRTHVSSMEVSLAQCMDSNSENCSELEKLNHSLQTLSDSLHSPLAAETMLPPLLTLICLHLNSHLTDPLILLSILSPLLTEDTTL